MCGSKQSLFAVLKPLCMFSEVNQSINQSINLYRAIVLRRVLLCGYAESKRNVLNVLTDGAVRQFSGREFQSLGAATEKRRAAVHVQVVRWN